MWFYLSAALVIILIFSFTSVIHLADHRLEYYVNILSFVDKDQLEPGCAILMHNKVFFSFYLVHIAFEKEQWWPDMFARTFVSLPFCCCNCAGSYPHDGQPKRLGAMESSISSAISSSLPIEGGNYLGCYLLEARGQWTF
jgi:hypothetical protein